MTSQGGEPGDRGQRSEKIEPWNPSFLADPGVRGSGWGPHLGTCFRGFLAEVGLGKEKSDKKVGVGFPRGCWRR